MSIYDSEKKIWIDEYFPSIFNPKASVGQLVLWSLKRGGNRIAEINDDYGVQWTFNQILVRSVQVAMSLKALGITKDAICCVISRNNPDLAPVMFGCFFIGTPVNSLDASFDQNDLDHMLGLTKPKVIFAEEDVLDRLKVSLKKLEIDSVIFCFTKDLTKLTDDVGTVKSFFKLNVEQEIIDSFCPTPIDDTETHISIIICSSGTTGLSKGVCLSQAQVVSQLIRAFPCMSYEIVFSFSSVYWITGMAHLLQGTIDGALRINTCKTFSPEYLFELVEKHKITRTFLSPSQIVSCLESKNISDANLSSLKVCYTGGSLILEDIRSQFEKTLSENAKVSTLYGLTEIGACCTWNYDKIKANSVGVLKHQNVAKIIDEDGKSVGPNEKGEICIKPPFTFLGYYNNEEETKGFRDEEGWMHSGDLGYFDDEGYLFISGRKKELIKYKNYQVNQATSILKID